MVEYNIAEMSWRPDSSPITSNSSPLHTYSSPLPHYSPASSPTNNSKKKPSSNARKKVELSAAEKQSFKCQKCGKCYNWNYNLNRHMRFECGIENRFECAMCHKRFPYKQNAAIHLKRKHKLALDNADDMIAAGNISLLPPTSGDQVVDILTLIGGTFFFFYLK